jgi:hypothetical protein
VLTLYFTPVYYIYLDKLRFGRTRPPAERPEPAREKLAPPAETVELAVR